MIYTKYLAMHYNGKPSTLKGCGWKARKCAFEEEIKSGDLYHQINYEDDVAILRSVILMNPKNLIFNRTAPNNYLFYDTPCKERLIVQFQNLVKVYEDNGVHVHIASSSSNMSPNSIFMRDSFAITPKGIILSRFASEQRKTEEISTQRTLAFEEFPISYRFFGDGVFEGADLLRIGNYCFLGIGKRTNKNAINQMKKFNVFKNKKFITISVPHHCQHLLGAINFISSDLVVLNGKNRIIHNTLENLGYKVIQFEENKETKIKRSLNFVTLSPGKILIPSNSPNTTKILQNYGVKIIEADVSEYLKAAGGIGCITGILNRYN